jgi:polyribonucleotide nucleotidyltransferase
MARKRSIWIRIQNGAKTVNLGPDPKWRENGQFGAGVARAGGTICAMAVTEDHEILAARIIDRSIRPLFPEGFKNEVQVFIYVISADQENDADVLALVAASFALNASKIPFLGPIAGVRVGRVQGHWVLNPTFQQLAFSDMELVVAGSQDSIVMVEGGALEVSEEDVLESLRLSHDGIRELIAMQNELLGKVQQPKMSWTKAETPEAALALQARAAEIEARAVAIESSVSAPATLDETQQLEIETLRNDADVLTQRAQ